MRENKGSSERRMNHEKSNRDYIGSLLSDAGNGHGGLPFPLVYHKAQPMDPALLGEAVIRLQFDQTVPNDR